MFDIVSITQEMSGSIAEFISENWGAPVIITRGKIHSALKLQGFVLMVDGEIKGLITYDISGCDCEIVSLDSLIENQGLGTGLIDKVVEKAKEQHCRRVWLITTNDNTKAIRYYQKIGFTMCGLYLNAIAESRKIKPQIPLKGFDDIPILHEVEFEKFLE